MKDTAPALPLRVQQLKPSTKRRRGDPKQTHRVRKASQTVSTEKAVQSGPPMGNRTVKHCDSNSKEDFELIVAICKYVQQIRYPRCCVSQFVSSDPHTQTIVVHQPISIGVPFYATGRSYSIAEVKVIKETLISYIRLLYRLGVGFDLHHQNFYVLETPSHPHWMIYLDGLMFAPYYSPSWRKDQDWLAEEKLQYERVEQIFRPIERQLALFKTARKIEAKERAAAALNHATR